MDVMERQSSEKMIFDPNERGIKVMDELKPCPFCGGEAELFHSYGGFHLVQCTCCACGTTYMRREIGAVRMWNRRVGEEKQYETD